MNHNDMPADEKEWRKRLSPEQYKVLREGSTEQPFMGKFLKNKDKGKYICAGCGAELFSSDTKFDSGTGWPSFFDANSSSVELRKDNEFGMSRVEAVCKKCGGHLGHVFDDAPHTPTGKRYCINSCSLKFKKK
ncbi:MAG: peptide-methionine (R)-S-oxide reductase MsrB [Nanoarchaeota archaeon]|nr:peptide-methionine (R)-S-oxide reductase MsrB [Nanoarchaeota archaeon]